MKDFKTLKVWEKSHELALNLYKFTKEFPREEIYGLTSQIRRAGLSIPTNLAEGCGRNSDADFARFLSMAMGSACELEYLLLVSKNLKFLPSGIFEEIFVHLEEIKKMLVSFIQKLKADC